MPHHQDAVILGSLMAYISVGIVNSRSVYHRKLAEERNKRSNWFWGGWYSEPRCRRDVYEALFWSAASVSAWPCDLITRWLARRESALCQAEGSRQDAY